MTISKAQVLALTTLAAAALLLSARMAAAESVGFIAAARGSVEVRPGGAVSFAAAAVDREVSVGDAIRTGRDSMAKILLADDTTLTIGDETELVIDEYVLGAAATRETSTVRMLSGQMRTRVGEAFGGPTRLEVHTPTAVIGVKGTTYECRIDRESGEPATTCCLIEGSITIRNIDPSVAGSYEPPVGECSRILPRAVPEQGDEFQLLGSLRGVVVTNYVDPVLPPVGPGPEGPPREVPEGDGDDGDPFDPGTRPGGPEVIGIGDEAPGLDDIDLGDEAPGLDDDIDIGDEAPDLDDVDLGDVAPEL